MITSFPNFTPISTATRAATDIAATLLGWVHPTFLPPSVNPASWRYWGIWVVFPDPVSPSIIKTYCRDGEAKWMSNYYLMNWQGKHWKRSHHENTWWSRTALMRSSLKGNIGRLRLVSSKFIFLFWASETVRSFSCGEVNFKALKLQ